MFRVLGFRVLGFRGVGSRDPQGLLLHQKKEVCATVDMVVRIWGIWGSHDNIPKAMFYLLKGDYNP